MSERSGDATDQDIPTYSWWPDGVPVANLNSPDCADCYRLLHALARQRRTERGAAPATAAGDASLRAFADGGDA
jgi:hypothetical protein